MTTPCGGSSARALVIHTWRVRPRDRRDERRCGPRLHHHRGLLLRGRLDASTTRVSFLDPPTPRLPPLPRLELSAVLLPISSTALPCSLVPALDECMELTCLRSRCAQDRWQPDIGAANGEVSKALEGGSAYSALNVFRGVGAIARPPEGVPFGIMARCARATCSRARAHHALPAPSAHAPLTLSRGSSLWSRIEQDSARL